LVGGYYNSITGRYNSIIGGDNNYISSSNSAIIGGSNNLTSGSDTILIGTGLTANRVCSTFVNNLSIMNIPDSNVGLPTGSIWRDGDVLKIIN
jgi:hypothetical protein